MIRNIEQWIQNRASVSVLHQILVVDGSCDVKIDDFSTEPQCGLATTDRSTTDRSTTVTDEVLATTVMISIVGVGVGVSVGVLFAVTVVLVVIVVIAVSRKHKNVVKLE